MTRKESTEYCNDPNNNIRKYLVHMIMSQHCYHNDKKRTELHHAILKDFDYEINESTIEKSKHIFGNIPRIFTYYLMDIGTGMVDDFMTMLTLKYITKEERLDNAIRFVAGFLTEKRTRDFIEGNLKPYNDISIYDLVFISNIDKNHNGMHDYYSFKK
jgi:hypothetical protein